MIIPIRWRILVILAALNLAFGISHVSAQGEHSRRAAAEIGVLIGDLRRLQAPDTPTIHKTGLRDRIKGGFAALDILLRLADQELGKPVSKYKDKVNELSLWLDEGKLGKAESLLARWRAKYPLTLPDVKVSDQSLVLGKQLHQSLCAHCHDHPNSVIERPAYNLFSEARDLPQSEFLARLFVGVRGDRITGIDNPLSDYEIAALIQFYHQEEQ